MRATTTKNIGKILSKLNANCSIWSERNMRSHAHNLKTFLNDYSFSLEKYIWLFFMTQSSMGYLGVKKNCSEIWFLCCFVSIPALHIFQITSISFEHKWLHNNIWKLSRFMTRSTLLCSSKYCCIISWSSRFSIKLPHS